MTQETKILAGIGVITLIILVVGVFFLSRGNSPVTSSTEPVSQDLLIKSDTPKIASDSATVNLVEFGDFQCPACQAANPGVKQILGEYSGRVSFYFRHFPLVQHKNAKIAAAAAEAAGEQNKFFEMGDRLFTSQREWENSGEPKELFKKYATELGLDVAKFETDLNSGKYDDKINRDVADGYSAKVDSTPTFFINNKKFDQNATYQNLKNAIDQELQ